MDAITGVSNSAAQGASTAERRSALTSDFDTFLQMLTAQARNQDPLDPLDASDYASQLATFSAVEQQVLTNDLLKEISASMAGSALERLRNWVGADILAPVPAEFGGDPVTLRAAVPDGTTRAEIVAQDASGAIVSRTGIDPVTGFVTWDGRAASGDPVPPGRYALTIESFEGDELISSAPAEVFVRVAEARWNAEGETVLILEDGTELLESEAAGLRVTG
ncbi:flagellar hook capping FlgD N-terminal domain-containing protein [Roseivivax halodurans]|nr:flagellar hook capping FlgD N-terminal domain-containing protein [Roseivivax halodurans]